MTHEELKDKCRKAFGAEVPISARERWAIFVREKRTEFTFRYEWIRDPRFYKWVAANAEHLDINDGEEWFGVYVCNQDGSPKNNYSPAIS